jgi:ribonuclease VapC
MIVLDSSAIIAILLAEPEARQMAGCIAAASRLAISAVQLHETGVVLHRRHGPAALRDLFDFVQANGIRVLPFDHDDALAAIAAYQRFGKGTGHPAQLNLADCAAYALATRLNAPLLFKGEDFARTDVTAAAPSA